MKLIAPLLLTAAISIQSLSAEEHELPSPAEFDAEKYLGKWFEVARLPTAMQPAGSLATAEYSAGEEGAIVVRNTAYSAEGAKMAAIEGKALPVGGDSKGRLRVGFGPVVPDEPNYCVLKVDKKYQTAVVGSPDRKSLWVLARKVPVPEKRVKRLLKVAEKAGFDTSKAVVATWPESFAGAKGKKKDGGAKVDGIGGHWTLHLVGPNGIEVELPMELEVDGGTLSGRISRGDGRWMKVEEGKVDGEGGFTFTANRDRGNGEIMSYAMAGSLEDGQLVGRATTEFQGRGEITSDWKAKRKAAKAAA